MAYSAEFWIEHLGMTAHPEGGYYTETYRSTETYPVKKSDTEFDTHSPPTHLRAASTAIYFLLRAGEVSHFHRIKSDEMWHFYAGDPLNVYCLRAEGRAPILHLGPDPKAGQWFQGVVPKDTWFGAKLAEFQKPNPSQPNASPPNASPPVKQGYALVGCTVAPGFDFSDFELAKRAELTQTFPQHAELIKALTP